MEFSDLDIIKEDFENSFTDINIELLKSPNIDQLSNKQYCNIMTSESINYDELCNLSTSFERYKKNRLERKKKKSHLIFCAVLFLIIVFIIFFHYSLYI